MFRPPRGTRDFFPEDMIKRNRVLDTVKRIFESYGYDPLGTPAFESLEMLKLKSGEDIIDQIYYFKDKSGRELGLRFEMTASMARVVASRRDLQLPFKRYAIGPAWRYERPSAGKRLREFYQADVDIVGTDDPISDAEVLSVAVDCLRILGFKDFQVRINDRRILEGVMEVVGISRDESLDVFRTLDKLDKIGKEGVEEALGVMGIGKEEAKSLLEFTDLKGSPEAILEEVKRLLSGREAYLVGCKSLEGIVEYARLLGFSRYLIVDLSLARGLDYYTGPVFEIDLSGKDVGSVAGGGRYDQLIELYGGRSIPATGISLGIERIMTLLEERGFFEPVKTRTQVFVAYTSISLRKEAIRIARRLREAGLRVDMDLMGRNLSNQLEYVAKKDIGLAAIVGERELREGCVALKIMKKEEQINVSLEDLVDEVKARLPFES